MSGKDDATDWRQLREFAAVDLTRSFILSWHVESETLFIDVDLLLTDEHPFYEKPRPAEKICIRPAIVEFPFCEALALKGRPKDSVQTTVDALGHGAITGLRRLADGCYEIEGDFGTVLIDAERPLLRLKNP